MINIKHFELKARKFVASDHRARLERLADVKAGSCRYNFRCQMNAVHDAEINGHKSIGMTMVVDKDYTYIHFLNFDGKRFIDNTLGVWSSEMEYYLIKMIDVSDFRKIDAIFTDYRKVVRRSLPWWMKLFTDFEA